MRLERVDPPREFTAVGIPLRHVANVELEPDEQLSFVTTSGTEFDVVRKSWGYYATPSLNGRLADHGLRGVLVRGAKSGKMFVLLVERGREDDFQAYVEWDGLQIVSWLDTHEATDELAGKLGLLSG